MPKQNPLQQFLSKLSKQQRILLFGGAGFLVVVIIVLVLFFAMPRGKKVAENQLPMPNFVGQQYSIVLDFAQKNNLTLSVSYTYSDTVEKGFVVDQNLEPESDAFGQIIEITLSKGSSSSAYLSEIDGENLILPDVVGKSVTELEKWVAANDPTLDVQYTGVYDNTLAKDMVISLEPEKEVRVGATLIVSVSMGKPEVPDFTNQSYTAYSQTFNTLNQNGAKLVPQVTYQYSDTITKNNIITQTPAAGPVNVGSNINFVVSLGKYTPGKFTGTLAQAQAALASENQKGAGWTLIEGTPAYSSSVPAGQLISASQVENSTNKTITVIVSLGPSTPTNVTVGNYVGQYYTGITNPTGLTISPVAGTCSIGNLTYCASNAADVNKVYEQNPAAGTSVASGSVVTVKYYGVMTIPALVGNSGSDVASILSSCGFTSVTSVTETNPDSSNPALTAPGVVWKVEQSDGSALPSSSHLAISIKYYVNP
ncbi:MAG: PASTA domain-containing protein [Erysipelotrichaceae bacterium]|nr:PASTA domain-containing protein [Erysipelotrichaceae bacterium]